MNPPSKELFRLLLEGSIIHGVIKVFIPPPTKFLELFFSNLLLGTNYELKNRYMHIDFVDETAFQSARSKTPKCQIGTLDCTLEGLFIAIKSS